MERETAFLRAELSKVERGRGKRFSSEVRERVIEIGVRAARRSRELGADRPRARNELRDGASLVHRDVAATECTCPYCDVELTRICIEKAAEKLDVEPSKYIVSQTQVETCACRGTEQKVPPVSPSFGALNHPAGDWAAPSGAHIRR